VGPRAGLDGARLPLIVDEVEEIVYVGNAPLKIREEE
jgi:hypothetical protein